MSDHDTILAIFYMACFLTGCKIGEFFQSFSGGGR